MKIKNKKKSIVKPQIKPSNFNNVPPPSLDPRNPVEA